MNRKVFYDTIRKSIDLRSAKLVEGFEYILDEGTRRKTPLDKLAYITSTAYWETGRTMQPVREFGGEKYLRSKRYYPYVGMGYVQLTWKTNYEKATAYFQDILGIDVNFVADPKQLLKPEYAAVILFVGMEQGWFTGKALDDYLDGVDESDAEDLREFSNARRIVNGIDRQVEIGKIALVFEKGLRAAEYNPTTEIVVMPAEQTPPVGHNGGPAMNPDLSPVEETNKANKGGMGGALGSGGAGAGLVYLWSLTDSFPQVWASDPQAMIILTGLAASIGGGVAAWLAAYKARDYRLTPKNAA